MKRVLRIAVAAGLSCLLCLPLTASAAAKPKPDGEVPKAGLELAKTLTQVTGIAVSPLLGVSAVGAFQWMKAETPQQKAALPWFAQPIFWAPCLLLVAAVAFKDGCGTVIPPGLKKPFDGLEALENKLSGLVAAGAVIPVLVNNASKYMAAGGSAMLWPASTHFTGLAFLHVGAIDISWLLDAALVPLSLAMYAVVWMASHAINILILLSPWGAVDAALKAARTSLLGLLTITTWINPMAGAFLSVIIIIIAYFIAGWSFRLTVFGTLFCWDFFTLRRRRYRVGTEGDWLFTARKIAGVPIRTYGRLQRAADGSLVLVYRPWLVLPARELPLPREGLVVGRGVFYSNVMAADPGYADPRPLLLLPPRYVGHEPVLAQTYGIPGTRDIGLRRAWSWLREAFGFAPKPAPAAA